MEQTNKHFMQVLCGVKDSKIVVKKNVFLDPFVRYTKVLEEIDMNANSIRMILRFCLELLALLDLTGLIMMILLQHKSLY